MPMRCSATCATNSAPPTFPAGATMPFSARREFQTTALPKMPLTTRVALHMFVQFHLDKQLKAAVTYAHSIGVAMKGDIPIGVNRHSVEVWMNTRLFDWVMDRQVHHPTISPNLVRIGASPIYNWKEMKKDDYSWWCNRLKKMVEYFDAYRIDHILGFFRIFRIPIDSTIGLCWGSSTQLWP